MINLDLLSSVESLKRMEEITGKKLVYYSVDLLNKDALKEVFSKVSYITKLILLFYVVRTLEPGTLFCMCFFGDI